MISGAPHDPRLERHHQRKGLLSSLWIISWLVEILFYRSLYIEQSLPSSLRFWFTWVYFWILSLTTPHWINQDLEVIWVISVCLVATLNILTCILLLTNNKVSQYFILLLNYEVIKTLHIASSNNNILAMLFHWTLSLLLLLLLLLWLWNIL